jgi:hypothetical protein
MSAFCRNPDLSNCFDIGGKGSNRPRPGEGSGRCGDAELDRSYSDGGLGVLDNLPFDEKYDPGDVMFVDGVPGLVLRMLNSLRSLRSLAENCGLWPKDVSMHVSP